MEARWLGILFFVLGCSGSLPPAAKAGRVESITLLSQDPVVSIKLTIDGELGEGWQVCVSSIQSRDCVPARSEVTLPSPACVSYWVIVSDANGSELKSLDVDGRSTPESACQQPVLGEGDATVGEVSLLARDRLFRRTERGGAWRVITPTQNGYPLQLSPIKALNGRFISTAPVAGSFAVLMSSDGESWSTLHSFDTPAIESVIVGARIYFFSGRRVGSDIESLGVWYSDGVSFAPVGISALPSSFSRELRRVGLRYVMRMTASQNDFVGKLWTSTDGITFVPLTPPCATPTWGVLADGIASMTCDGNVFESADGLTFAPIQMWSSSFNSFRFDEGGTSTLYAYTSGYAPELYRRSDAATTWTSATGMGGVGGLLEGIEANGSSALLRGRLLNGGSVLTTDAGATWYVENSPRRVNGLAASEHYVVAVTEAGTVWRSADGLNGWEVSQCDVSVRLLDVEHVTGGVFVARGVTPAGTVLLRTVDDGAHWTSTALEGFSTRLARSDSSLLRCSATSTECYRMDFSTGVWTTLATNLAEAPLDIWGFDAGFIAQATSSTLLFSSDGQTWHQLTSGYKYQAFGLDAMFLLVGSPQGTNWHRITSDGQARIIDLPSSAGISSISKVGSRYIASGTAHLYTSNDGVTWTMGALAMQRLDMGVRAVVLGQRVVTLWSDGSLTSHRVP